jgi:hypothetical protein
MKWPEASTIIAAWLSVAVMMFSISKCCSDEVKAHAQIMSSPGTHVE